MLERAAFLFDGPNFYKNLRSSGIEKGHLDYIKLAQRLAQRRRIVSVDFFVSPVDRLSDSVNYANQQRFFAAIEGSGVKLHLGRLVENRKQCPCCGETPRFKIEKSVDVQFAIWLTTGAVEDKWDVAYIATCDSDMIPAINLSISRGKKIFLIMPQGARCYGVGNVCTSTIKITQDVINECQAES